MLTEIKNIYLLFVMGIICLPTTAQVFQGGFIKGGTGGSTGLEVSINSLGQKIVVGSYNNVPDLDPSSSTYTLPNPGTNVRHGFISVYSDSNQFLWASSFGSFGNINSVGSSVTDENDNIYIGGQFQGSFDANPGTASNMLTLSANTVEELYIAKLSPSGSYNWAFSIPCVGSSANSNLSIYGLDYQNGKILVCGAADGVIDFDPSPSNTNYSTATGSYSPFSVGFIAEYDTNGNYIWSNVYESFGSSGQSPRTAIWDAKYNSEGNITYCGRFSHSLDVDLSSSALSFNCSPLSYDALIGQIDSSGNHKWALQYGGSSTDYLYYVSHDSNDNIYTSGYMWNSSPATFDLDQGPGVNNQSYTAGQDALLMSFDKNGNHRWGYIFGGSNQQQRCRVVEVIGNNVVAGFDFESAIDVGPNDPSGSYTSSSGSDRDAVFARYDTSGNYIDDVYYGSTSAERIMAFNTNNNSSLEVLGYTAGTIDLDPSPSTFNISSNGSDNWFLATYNFCMEPSLASLSISSNSICSGDSTTLSITSGQLNSATNWHWYTGSCGGTLIDSGTTITVSPATSTTYYVRGEGACVTPGLCASTTVNVSAPPALTSVSTSPNCPGQSNGSIDLTATSSALPISFIWNTADTTEDVNGLTAGSYSVTATDSNGCSSSLVMAVAAPQPINILINLTPLTCGSTNNGSAAATANGGTSSLSFLWSNAATASTITNLTIGTYTLTVTDSLGCSTIDSASIGQLPDLTTSISSTDATCFGLADGSATASVSIGSSPFTYSWSNAGTTASISGLAANSYSVIISDSVGCVDTLSIIVSQPAAISSSITQTTSILCFGDSNASSLVSATNGVGSYTYLWSNGTTSATASQLHAGTFSVVVSDSNNCKDTSSIAISQPTQLQITATSTDVGCFGNNDGAANVTASGSTPGISYTYLWSNGATTSSITGLTSGNYSVTVTDSNNCLATANVNIGFTYPLPLPNLGISISQCSGTLQLYPGNFSNYSWSTGDTSSTTVISTTSSTSVTVTNAFGCQNSDTIQTTIFPTPSIAVSSLDANCNQSNGLANITISSGTAPYTINWNNGVQTTTNSNLSAGFYTVTVSDANGCGAISAAAVQNISAPSVNVVGQDVSCNGGVNGQALASATGGNPPLSFAWNNGSASAIQSNLNAGTYAVTVTDGAGCLGIGSIDIVEPAPIAILPNVQSSTCGSSNGSINTVITGGTSINGGYNYQWNTGATSSSVNGLSAGIYAVTITDSLGCNQQQSIALNDLQGPVMSSTVQGVTCEGDSNGQAGVQVISSNGPITIVWNDANAQTSFTATNLPQNTYIATGVDTNGCIGNVSATVGFQFAKPSLQLVDGQGCDQVTVSAPLGFASYQWSNGAATFASQFNSSGTYGLLVTDGNGCQAVDSAKVTVNSSPAINLGPDTIVCDSNISSFNLNAGSGFVKYQWSNGDSIQITNISSASTYSVTVTDANGCIGLDQIEIRESTCVGIENKTTNTNWASIWPNPSSGLINIQLETVLNSETQLRVFNSNGQLVIDETFYKNQYSRIIDLKHLAKGIYSLSLISDHHSMNQKIILN